MKKIWYGLLLSQMEMKAKLLQKIALVQLGPMPVIDIDTKSFAKVTLNE